MSHPGTAPHTLRLPPDANLAVDLTFEADNRTPFFSPELSDIEVETKPRNRPLLVDIDFDEQFKNRSELQRLIWEYQDVFDFLLLKSRT
jgi:hypothetical protein